MITRLTIVFVLVAGALLILYTLSDRSGEADFSKEISSSFADAVRNNNQSYDGNPWISPADVAVRNELLSGGLRRKHHKLRVGCGGSFRPSASADDQVTIRYVLKSREGVLDQFIHDDGVSVDLASASAIKGLRAGIVGACEGEVIELAIPPSLAFGERGYRALVPPKAKLYMLIHLLELRKSYSKSKVEHTEDEDAISALIIPVTAMKGEDCVHACTVRSFRCHSAGFQILNNCPRLRLAFPCEKCEIAAAGTAGADMPCYVSPLAPKSHPRNFCMVHPNYRKSECEAKYQHTQRLCPCVHNTDFDQINAIARSLS